MAILRSWAGSTGFALHARQLQHRLHPRIALRSESTASPPKPRLLEKPERFNPPSHPARIRSKPKVYGTPLSDRERVAQKTRKYPHMMPPEGSFMFWFLTSRGIHLVITLSVLLALMIGIWHQNFIHNTPYLDLLPPNSMFLAHPFRYMKQYYEVYEMHTTYVTEKTMERRKRNVEDVNKRAQYRKAHGLDEGDKAGWFGGWTAKTDDEIMGPGLKVDKPTDTATRLQSVDSVSDEALIQGIAMSNDETPSQRKKWFGIW